MESLNDLFSTKEAKQAQKALDYLDGCQLEHVISLLDNPNHGRRQWKERGMRPQYRNFTAMVVQKSGMLWDNSPPVLEVITGDSIDENASQRFNDELDSIQFQEFMQNFDEIVRLQKTAVILQQYDELNGRMILDILHKGNCVVKADPFTKQIEHLIYRVESDDDEYNYYRIYTPEVIQDWREGTKPGSRPEFMGEEENPYGFIPASQFHDTQMPRVGYWNKAPQDLVRFNDMYNLHLVDMEFAASWEIHKTLFTNTDMEGGTGSDQVVTEVYGSVLPRQVPSGNGVVGGLGSIVTVDSTGVEQPFVEYKGPESDLMKLQSVYQQWSKDFAGDWGVNLKFAGEGTADSGFQLVVESMDNLELRQKRQRFCENGLQRFYQVYKRVMNTHFGNVYPEDSELNAQFSQPNLPVNQAEQEQVWSLRIAEGRATPIDYYMEVHGMTKEEAMNKWEDVKQFNQENELEAVPGFVEEL